MVNLTTASQDLLAPFRIIQNTKCNICQQYLLLNQYYTVDIDKFIQILLLILQLRQTQLSIHQSIPQPYKPIPLIKMQSSLKSLSLNNIQYNQNNNGRLGQKQNEYKLVNKKKSTDIISSLYNITLPSQIDDLANQYSSNSTKTSKNKDKQFHGDKENHVMPQYANNNKYNVTKHGLYQYQSSKPILQSNPKNYNNHSHNHSHNHNNSESELSKYQPTYGQNNANNFNYNYQLKKNDSYSYNHDKFITEISSPYSYRHQNNGYPNNNNNNNNNNSKFNKNYKIDKESKDKDRKNKLVGSNQDSFRYFVNKIDNYQTEIIKETNIIRLNFTKLQKIPKQAPKGKAVFPVESNLGPLPLSQQYLHQYPTQNQTIKSLGNFLQHHKIDGSLRARMLDWMVEVNHSYHFTNRTYFLGVMLMDRYFHAAGLAGQILMPQQLHIIGVACISISTKLEEVYPLKTQTIYQKIVHRKISIASLLQMESTILQALEFSPLSGTLFQMSMFKTLQMLDQMGVYTDKTMKQVEDLVGWIWRILIFQYSLIKDLYTNSNANKLRYMQAVVLYALRLKNIGHFDCDIQQLECIDKIKTIIKGFKSKYKGLNNVMKYCNRKVIQIVESTMA